MNRNIQLTPDLARAARALTQVSVRHIAHRAEVEKHQLRGFERFSVSLTQDECVRVLRALESFGVAFISEDGSGGYGVRRRFTEVTSQRMSNWEDEGGPVADDDI